MRVRALDLFHGAGGSSWGASAAGVDIVAGIDLWEIASKSFELNFPKARSICENIFDCDPGKIHKQIGKIDLLLASPECTSHSCARGSREKSESSLMTAFQVPRFAKEFRPRWIIVENVIQMLGWKKFPALMGQIESLGYSTQVVKLNSQDFGVPQSRRRAFLLCSVSKRIPEISPVKQALVPASKIILQGEEYQFSPLFSEKRAKPTVERANRAISEIGQKKPFLIVYYGSDGSGGWQPLDRPLRTITTLDRFAFVRPGPVGHEMRMLQPPELKAAMGFSESFQLPMATRRDLIRLIGNAVCPPVMEEIVKKLLGKDGW
jgi:DNA (cytosine-5)-methyltransferase 1